MLNTNDAQRKRYAAKDHNLKLQLEATLTPQLIKFFRQYGDDFAKRYEALGFLPDFGIYKDKLSGILQPHYNKVANVFSKRIVDTVGKPDNHDDVLNTISQRTDTFHAINADQSSQYIMQTTHDNAHNAIKKAAAAGIAAGLFLTRTQIAKQAKRDLLRTNINRVSGISMTETQGAAEHAKQSEFEALTFHGAHNIHLKKKQKQWNAVLDNVTRAAHAQADGQIVDYGQPYEVGGEKMMYPKDSSLGASLSNIINCRCSSVPIIR